MKKLLAFVLSAVMMISVIPFSESFVAEAAAKTVKSIEIVSKPEKTVYYYEIDGDWDYYCEYDEETDNYIEYNYFDYDIDRYGWKLKINYSDGSSVVTNDEYDYEDNEITVTGQEYGEHWGIGKHTVTVSYMGKTTSFEISVVESPFSGIEFEELNLKDSYIKGECPSLDGSKIRVKYKNGSSKVYTIDESETYNTWTYGYGDINEYLWTIDSDDFENGTDYTFNYLNFSIDFHINRSKLSVKTIELLSEPKSYDGIGADIKFSFSNYTSKKTKILDFSVACMGAPNGNYGEGGYVRTEIGVFEGCYEIENVLDTPNSSYKYCIGDMEFSNTAAVFKTNKFKTVSMYYKADNLIYYFLLIQEYNDYVKKVNGNVWYDINFSEENIDTWAIAADYIESILYYDYGMEWEPTRTAAEMDSLFSNLFDYDRLDLTKSKNYNPSTGIYTLPVDGGYGRGVSELSFETEHKDGLWYITRNEIDFSGTYKHYLIMTEDGKCTYAGTVEKSAAKLGDINNDGAINSTDALKALQHSVGIVTLTGNDFVRGDVNKDRNINSTDALLILQFAVGQINKF